MLSYANGTSGLPLLGETIGANLERTVARVPEAEALVSTHQQLRYTYAEFNDAVDRLATGLLAAGLEQGDRVGVWSPNRAEWALTQYATAKLGVILVNVNPAYRLSELEYALGHSGCRWIVAAPECKGSDFEGMVAEVQPNLSGLERAVFFGSPEWDELASRAVDHDCLAARRGAARLRRPDQHPVHERHDGLSEGRHAHPPQHPQQRLPRRRGVRL